jgi:hypothetical protein
MDLQTTNPNEFVRRQIDILRQVASPDGSHIQAQPEFAFTRPKHSAA